jgi:hypothetical protein
VFRSIVTFVNNELAPAKSSLWLFAGCDLKRKLLHPNPSQRCPRNCSQQNFHHFLNLHSKPPKKKQTKTKTRTKTNKLSTSIKVDRASVAAKCGVPNKIGISHGLWQMVSGARGRNQFGLNRIDRASQGSVLSSIVFKLTLVNIQSGCETIEQNSQQNMHEQEYN